MANVLGSIVIQDLTYTQKVHGQAFTITYENGGTAGAEVVRMNGMEVIIKIASGSSTATQIRAAFIACVPAVAIATCTVSGTGSNVQKSAVRAFLTGGIDAVKSAKPIAHGLRLQATTAGTAGNSIRIKFVDTGSLSVSASSSDITINIDDAVTTYDAIMQAIRASASVGALVQPFSPNNLVGVIADIVADSLPTAFANLAGGVASTKPAVVIQDLTYSDVTAGPTSKRRSVTYTTGATAGAEVVSLDANGSETIQIENGVSTATQIKTAHDAVGAALALRTVAVTGTGSTAQKTVNLAGGSAIASEATPSIKDYFINESTAALTGSFVRYNFGFHAEVITIFNDETAGAEYVEYSLDGINSGGRVFATESVTLNLYGEGAGISLRGDADAYRVNVTGV